MTVHATAVALPTPAGWRGVLLRGPSGSGKSDLALRLLGRGGWCLIGDDRIEVWASDGALYAAPAPRLAGAIEVRGLGLMQVPHVDLARLALLVDCGSAPERLPEPCFEEIQTVRLPVLRLIATEPSAPDKLRLALFGRDALSRLEP